VRFTLEKILSGDAVDTGSIASTVSSKCMLGIVTLGHLFKASGALPGISLHCLPFAMVLPNNKFSLHSADSSFQLARIFRDSWQHFPIC
jgi:hypothetical protein